MILLVECIPTRTLLCLQDSLVWVISNAYNFGESMSSVLVKTASVLLLLCSLTSCGSSEVPDAASNANSTTENASGSSVGTTEGVETSGNSEESLVTRFNASRFLAQSTFGPTMAAIDALYESDYESWISEQVALPYKTLREDFDDQQLLNPESAPSRDWIFESFWRRSVINEDQLRQRVAFALSQLFVISLRDGGVASSVRGAADFYSRLEQQAFGNFRTLLEEVTLHPVMGLYLSHLGNEKGDAASGRQPDENYAREVMQLFTIGLYELNPDGSNRLSGSGQPIETYTNTDVQGLARVFTGFSWNGPDRELGRFQGWIADPNREIMLMQDYPYLHSTREKSFLGMQIPANDVPDPLADLSVALDTLFNHPNVGPFICRQLIQRLVSSNPSPAYIERVASTFNNNGSGVRGDMAAVVTAILMDPEARNMDAVPLASRGRLREPILRLSHWMRSFEATSVSGRYSILGTDDPATDLGMTVLRSPSVFNFYRPQYVPPSTPIAAANLVSPEMQITHETSVAGYLNSMLNTTELGGGSSFDISSDYAQARVLAHDSTALVDHVDLLMTHGGMSDELKSLIKRAVELVSIEDDSDTWRLSRSRLAVYLTMSSPEYLVLK